MSELPRSAFRFDPELVRAFVQACSIAGRRSRVSFWPWSNGADIAPAARPAPIIDAGPPFDVRWVEDA